MSELKQQYQNYKATHSALGNRTLSRPIISLLYFYGEKMSLNTKCEFEKLANSCQTEAEADLLASAIIIAITQ